MPAIDSAIRMYLNKLQSQDGTLCGQETLTYCNSVYVSTDQCAFSSRRFDGIGLGADLCYTLQDHGEISFAPVVMNVCANAQTEAFFWTFWVVSLIFAATAAFFSLRTMHSIVAHITRMSGIRYRKNKNTAVPLRILRQLKYMGACILLVCSRMQ
jgi:hypothetical protein